jgi:superfamily II DNA/RNA helicase
MYQNKRNTRQGGFGRFRKSSGFNRFARVGGKTTTAMVKQFILRATTPKASYQPNVDNADVAPIEFATLELDAQLKASIAQRGYTTGTPIQSKAIPAILEGRDVVGVANTGTGKTAAFLIPIVQKIITNRVERALILAPTRELALQIRDELRGLTKRLYIQSACLIGKASMSFQIKDLKQSPQVVVATPGRLRDLAKRKAVNLQTFTILVVDEVDRMLDMGFMPEVKEIIALLPPKRQSLFFSATVTSTIENLIRSFSTNPLRISVKQTETVLGIAQSVVQVASTDSKIKVLQEILTRAECTKAIVFGRTKIGVDKITIELQRVGCTVESIHGDKPQHKRIQAIRRFKDSARSVLVATDVAARGLDIENVSHVINYDPPGSYEDYIHRIGRTGRAESTGIALTFVD